MVTHLSPANRMPVPPPCSPYARVSRAASADCGAASCADGGNRTAWRKGIWQIPPHRARRPRAAPPREGLSPARLPLRLGCRFCAATHIRLTSAEPKRCRVRRLRSLVASSSRSSRESFLDDGLPLGQYEFVHALPPARTACGGKARHGHPTAEGHTARPNPGPGPFNRGGGRAVSRASSTIF